MQYVPYSTAAAYNDMVYSTGLETISETQPLHSVLSLEKQPYERELPRYVYEDGSRVMFLNPNNVEYHPSNKVAPTWSSRNRYIQPQYEIILPPTSPHQYSEPINAPNNSNYSLSEAFHDRVQALNSPISSYHARSSSQSSESNVNPRTASISKQSSFHENHPQRLKDTQIHSSSDTQATTATSQYGEVSMEETQQIIENIDRLIEN